MKFILGTKLGMTQVFRQDGTVVPVTRVQAGPCVVTQVKTAKKDGVGSVQVGFGSQKKFRLNKAIRGHLKDLTSMRFIREFRTDLVETGLERGDTFTLTVFSPGDKVQVVGKSKGKGFQGVVKRHGFRGSPASHGHKDQLRMPGSIGATGPARVFKGTRMAGHMGDARITVKNLEIVEVHEEAGELFIKGAVPGARGGLLLISSDEGVMEIQKSVAPTEEAKEEVQEEMSSAPEMSADVDEGQEKESTVSTEESHEAPASEEKTEEKNKDDQ